MLLAKAEATQIEYFTPQKLNFLRRHYAKDATPEEFEHFIEVSKSRGLRPDARQIYLIKLGGRSTIVLSIDAYRLIAQRTGLYAGITPAIYVFDEDGKILSATITVKKLVQGHVCEFSGTALFSEHNRPGRADKKSLWDSMPATMLEKCAEAKALRKAFPEELSGYYTKDEMEVAESPIAVVDDEPIVQTSDPRVKSWIHKKLREAMVPDDQWEEILDSLNGFPKNQLLMELKKILAALSPRGRSDI